MAKKYREGHEEPSEKNEGTNPTPGEWFSTPDSSEIPPHPPVEGVDMSNLGADDILSAVLIVKYRNGIVVPIMNIPDLKMHHKPSPHEVLRMCLDVADQISTMRVIGEVGQLTKRLIQAGNEQLMQAIVSLKQGGSK